MIDDRNFEEAFEVLSKQIIPMFEFLLGTMHPLSMYAKANASMCVTTNVTDDLSVSIAGSQTVVTDVISLFHKPEIHDFLEYCKQAAFTDDHCWIRRFAPAKDYQPNMSMDGSIEGSVEDSVTQSVVVGSNKNGSQKPPMPSTEHSARTLDTSVGPSSYQSASARSRPSSRPSSGTSTSFYVSEDRSTYDGMSVGSGTTNNLDDHSIGGDDIMRSSRKTTSQPGRARPATTPINDYLEDSDSATGSAMSYDRSRSLYDPSQYSSQFDNGSEVTASSYNNTARTEHTEHTGTVTSYTRDDATNDHTNYTGSRPDSHTHYDEQSGTNTQFTEPYTRRTHDDSYHDDRSQSTYDHSQSLDSPSRFDESQASYTPRTATEGPRTNTSRSIAESPRYTDDQSNSLVSSQGNYTASQSEYPPTRDTQSHYDQSVSTGVSDSRDGDSQTRDDNSTGSGSYTR